MKSSFRALIGDNRRLWAGPWSFLARNDWKFHGSRLLAKVALIGHTIEIVLKKLPSRKDEVVWYGSYWQVYGMGSTGSGLAKTNGLWRLFS